MPKQKNKPSKLAASLGKRIRERRLQLKLTQSGLAEQIGIDPETVSRIERGTVLPGLLRLEEIATALKTGVSGLLANASSLPDDQAQQIVAMLRGMDEQDRLLVLDSMKRFGEYLRGKNKRL